jgi:hypothetical protein
VERLTELGRATTHGQALPLGVDDPVVAARAVRRALAAAGRRAMDVTSLVVASTEPIPSAVLARFTRRALGPHGAVIAVNAHEPGATDAEALAAHAASRIPAPDGADGAGEPGSGGGEAPARVTNRPGVAVVVGLGTDGTVVAVCLGRPPDHGSARRRA